jgi:hypothetical protein
MGPHQRILNSADVFSSAIETSVTPCQPLREERESGAPPLRETTFQREPTESYRCIKGADSISLIQFSIGALGHLQPCDPNGRAGPSVLGCLGGRADTRTASRVRVTVGSHGAPNAAATHLAI